MQQELMRHGQQLMKKRIERLRGMRDLLPDVYQQQRQIIDRLQGSTSRGP